MFDRGQDFGLKVKLLTFSWIYFFLCSFVPSLGNTGTGRGNILLVVSIADLIEDCKYMLTYASAVQGHTFKLYVSHHKSYVMDILSFTKNVISKGNWATLIISKNPLLQCE